MLPRRSFNQFTVIFFAISTICIALGIQSVRTAPSKLNSGSPGGITARKPVLPQTQPIDWDQPVKIIPTGKQPRFPLTLSEGDEYLLIINNLEQVSHRTQSVQLSAEFNSSAKTPLGCYFQNTPPLPQTLPENQRGVPSQAVRLPSHQTAIRESNSKPESAASERSFFLFVTDGSLSDRNQYSKIKSRLIQQSDRVAIYLDQQQKEHELASGLVDGILETLEHQVLDKITSQCGPIRDVDQDGRFTILLSPWLSKLQGGKTSINGFVRPSDFRETVSEPFSNHCDMLYLNSALKPGQELLDLLSHEVTHAAVSSLRAVQSNSPASPLMDEEDWLNEGIAHIMEPGYTNRDYRISEFYRKPDTYPLVVPDYYRAQLWRNHGCRGAVSLFLDWCNQIESTQRFPYRFTHHPLTGTRKIEQLTAHPFPELFRLWSLSLAQQTLHPGIRVKTGSDQSPFHCGKFLLTGPAFQTWNLSNTPQASMNIASTASGFLHFKTDEIQNGNITIKVNGFSKMQLTLLKISQNCNRLSLTATEHLPATNNIPAVDFLDVRLTCKHPAGSTVKTISVERSGAYLSRSSRRPRLFQTASLNSLLTLQSGKFEIANQRTYQENGNQVTDFLIRIPRTTLQKESKADCLTFKTIVQTETQIQIAAQTDFKIPTQPVQRLTEVSKPTKN